MDNPDQPYALVTGGAGFLGSHVVRALLDLQRVQIVVLDDLSGGFQHNVPEGVEFVEGSILDHSLLHTLFETYRFRYVYHLAAYAAEGLSHFIRRFNYTNNVIGSINLINESVRTAVDCFVFTSSIAVYGSIAPPMRESDSPHPEDPYGIAKYTVELDLRTAREMFGLRSVIFRPHNVYGEFQNLGDPYRNVIGIFMNKILQSHPLPIFGDGTQRRAFSYVGDIAPIIARSPWVSGATNEVFNVGADHDYSVNDLAKAVCLAMGTPDHPVEHLPARNEVKVAYADHSKVKQVFGNDSATNLESGLSRMALWAKRVGIQQSKLFEGIEIQRNLPVSWQRLMTPCR